jgi:phosphoribosylformimino-5-aminoimidazole carboxamide ribotide isomerase
VGADADYSEGASSRPAFAGHFRYVVSPHFRWQISPGFTWSGYSSKLKMPVPDGNFPADTQKSTNLVLLLPMTFQLQYLVHTKRWHYHLGAGPGVYRLWIENERVPLVDPVSFFRHQGLYAGVSGELGVERFVRALPSTSVEACVASHWVFAQRDDQFPTGYNSFLAATEVPIQLGGGIRDMATIEGWLGKGVNRVIIGTAAVRDPALVKAAAKKYPKRVAVGLDAKNGKVAVEGWAATSELSALDIARRFEDAGVAAIIYTDVARDGMLKGINWDATIALADAISIPVIASGGLASIDDVRKMTEPRARKLEGAITGRALYDGRLNGAEALAVLRAARR